MPRPSGQDVRTRTLDQHFSSIHPATPQIVAKEISHRTFIRSDGFDVDQTAGKRKQFHAAKA
jgi:hypothetical protein